MRANAGIEAQGAWKRYRLQRPTLRDRLADLWPANRREGAELRKEFWALKDVSFRAEPPPRALRRIHSERGTSIGAGASWRPSPRRGAERMVRSFRHPHEETP